MIRVALVEDLDEIREALQELIDGSDNFECRHTYANGTSALNDLPSHEVDVVIMDIHLPDISGIKCVEELAGAMPGVNFMMHTVYEDDDNIFNALKAGAMGYILKRSSPNQILEALIEIDNGGSPMSSEIARRVVSSFKGNSGGFTNEASQLTNREKEILNYLAKGYLYKEIAAELFISLETVKKHIHHIYEKLHVQTRTEALNKAFGR